MLLRNTDTHTKFHNLESNIQFLIVYYILYSIEVDSGLSSNNVPKIRRKRKII
jgi:hypothetical protein